MVDLFSGCGTLNLPLVAKGMHILAVEQDCQALAALTDGAGAAQIGSQVRRQLADLANTPLTAADFVSFDAVIS